MLDSNFITSWDDGHKLDMRLYDLLLEYDIPAIFFISAENPSFEITDLLDDAEIQKISKKFEIGGHTDTHPEDLKLLSTEDVKTEIDDNKSWLKVLTGKNITKFCYPGGRYNEDTIKVLKRCGVREARTTVILNTDKPKNSYRIKTTIHVRPDRREYEGKYWLEAAKERWNEAVKKGKRGYFHLWGHSWEIEQFGLWEELEDFFAYIQKDLSWWNKKYKVK